MSQGLGRRSSWQTPVPGRWEMLFFTALAHRARGSEWFSLSSVILRLWGAFQIPHTKPLPAQPGQDPWEWGSSQEIPMCTQGREPLFWMVPEASVSTSQVAKNSLRNDLSSSSPQGPEEQGGPAGSPHSSLTPQRILGESTLQENCNMKDKYSLC